MKWVEIALKTRGGISCLKARENPGGTPNGPADASGGRTAPLEASGPGDAVRPLVGSRGNALEVLGILRIKTF